MSALQKSASFRSRIPVRHAKVDPPRPCDSSTTGPFSEPPPNQPNGYKTIQSHVVVVHSQPPQTNQQQKPPKQQQRRKRREYYGRQCHARLDVETCASSNESNSSSDESDRSEVQLTVIPFDPSEPGYNHFTGGSTDAMSLDGLLDSVSCGSFSRPASPRQQLGLPDPSEYAHHSSFDSLEKIHSAAETLKLTHDRRFLSQHDHINRLSSNGSATHQLTSPPSNDLKTNQKRYVQRHLAAEIQANNNKEASIKDLEKQRQLSDWYYIKSAPTNNKQQPPHTTKPVASSAVVKRVRPLPPVPHPRVLSDLPEPYEVIATRTTPVGVPPPNAADANSEVISQIKRLHMTERPALQSSDDVTIKSTHFQWENGKSLPSRRLLNRSLIAVDFDAEKDTNRLSHSWKAQQSPSIIDIHNESEQVAAADSKNELYPPKSSAFHTECDISGSYVSLECPSPPGPPACLSDAQRNPQTRLSSFLKVLYTEFALREPIIPEWAQPTAPGALCPARLEPELRLCMHSHGCTEFLSVDQLLTSIQTKDGAFLEAPRRLLVECPSWCPRHSLALRILYAWAKDAPWPKRGVPVAVALFIPLSELKKGFAHYIEKELIDKGPKNPFGTSFGNFAAAWNSLAALGPKLLIIIDGYDQFRASGGTPKRKSTTALPNDVQELLEGRLFPESRVIVISVTHNNKDLLPLMQRHVTYNGLTWGRSASLLGGGQWGAPTRLLDMVQSCPHLRHIARTPLGCLALTSIYVTTGNDLPTEEIDCIESVISCVTSDASPSNVAEIGRLALFCLKTKRSMVTTSDIRIYCSHSDDKILESLDKAQRFGKTAKKKADQIYTPICPGISEFLAASYLASLANRPGLLAAEITGLSLGDEIDPDLLKVLTFAMGLLSSRAHILLSKLTPLWLSPQTVFSLALAGGNSVPNLNTLCDLLGISKTPPISPLETNPIWVQIRSTPNELLGWAMALKSPSCALKNLELNYQIEKHMLIDSQCSTDIFLDALTNNDSVSTLRISSLIEMDVKESDINCIAKCVARAILKPRLENFELILTLLEEDPPLLKLQSVVTALCRSLLRQTGISSLLLDLGLCTSQIIQVCTTLEKCNHITRLSLPHLRCDRGAIGAVASLLAVRQLSSLALPSCWGARDDPPSSSGVSMGSGSGSSSTGTSGLIKQSSLTGSSVPSPRSYPTGIFSSLPRGVIATNTIMGRSATLPRQQLDFQPADKRSCDSVISKTWYPTPACDGGPHSSGTLHDLLLTAREPQSRLNGLDMSKAQMSLEDSMCLGETVRLSRTLHTLKMEGATRLSEILPSVLGAGESQSLQMMVLSSPRLALEDSAVAMTARSLANCTTLRLLGLDGWSFRVETETTLMAVRTFLAVTSVRELGLANCRLYLSKTVPDIGLPLFHECPSVITIKLAGAQVILSDSSIMRGPQLLPFMCGFSMLRELDLSAPVRSGLGSSTSTTPLIIDDKCLVTFFQALNKNFTLLNTLKLCNWMLHLDDASRSLKTMAKYLRNSPLNHIKADGISVLDRPKKSRIEHQFMHSLVTSVPSLRWFGISLAGKKDEQIVSIGNSLMEMKGNEIDIRLSESTIDSARLLAQTIGYDGKFDIRVSTFGTSSGILVHVERINAKHVSRKA